MQILTRTNEAEYFYEAVKIWATANLNYTAALTPLTSPLSPWRLNSSRLVFVQISNAYGWLD